ncbi:cytochrome P450 monooxygenase pc-3 [Mycena albidolilacea]|uniref:Cytochrome P450 monooxygenase pc-3 n=1 Tax=Mycena albidolilacea TaxID=1033008 RepID=A0AAD7EGK4_9AGAR|nr:cytochrome P450 monooxygenase pc-3 [Mycena albidolilacea]
MELPPGLVYLAGVLPITLLPSALTYAFLTRILPLLDCRLPLWARILAAVLAQPAGVIVGHLFQEWRYARDAASRGAVQIPAVPAKWPGGLSLIAAMKKTSYPGDFLQDWCDRYGNTVVANILFDRAIFTLEPEYIKAILATDFDNYWKGPDANHLGQSLLGFGVFNSDDDMWKFHRTMSRPFFNKERISDFDLFDRHTHDALSRIKQRLAEGYAVDIQDCVSRFTLDSATAFLFGASVSSLAAGLPYPSSAPAHLANSPAFLTHPSNTYVRAFTQGQILMVERAAFGSKWPLAEFWKDKVKPHRVVADAYVEGIVEKALERKRAGKQGDGKPDGEQAQEQETFLSHLVQATDDKEVIRDSIFNILVAGRDTTAATLTFAVYMLAEHPAMAARLRREVLVVVGGTRMPTYDDVRGMKYLRAFINETLRLYPPVPFDSRTSKNATVWPALKPGDKPLYVTPNSKVRYSVFLMHRRTDLWGPDALEFDPDRFLDERLKKYLTPNPFIFLPFNAGPRICLGQQFAYNEASFFLIRLLQKFSHFELAPDAQPESTKAPESWKKAKGTQATEKIMLSRHLIMFAKGGLWLKMKPVSGDHE